MNNLEFWLICLALNSVGFIMGMLLGVMIGSEFVHRRYRSMPKPSEGDRAVIITESSRSATIAAEALYHTKASEVLHNAGCQHLRGRETIEQKVCKDCRRRGR
jgi:hypothetical protein